MWCNTPSVQNGAGLYPTDDVTTNIHTAHYCVSIADDSIPYFHGKRQRPFLLTDFSAVELQYMLDREEKEEKK